MRRFAVVLSLLANSAFGMFLPPNNLHLEHQLTSSEITLADFNRIADQVIAMYAPEAQKLGASLSVVKKWDDDTVNAYAQQNGSQWLVTMFGGLARRAEVTLDGFALVVCHEVGHHFGGYPTYQASWASSEGQADYFATQTCAKRLWAGSKPSDDADMLVKEKCKGDGVCERAAMAGKSLASLLAALGGSGVPDFDTPDPSVVGRTVTSHPRGQCRLDTYFQGAICPVKFRNGIIPGKGNPNGEASLQAQFEAFGSSCAARPRCWFAPL